MLRSAQAERIMIFGALARLSGFIDISPDSKALYHRIRWCQSILEKDRPILFLGMSIFLFLFLNYKKARLDFSLYNGVNKKLNNDVTLQ